jgi:hypothetical protein
MAKYRCKYEFTRDPFAARHVWTCIGRHGAMHLHIADMGEENAKKYGDQFSGGLETHYRQPPKHMRDDAPSQDKCWLLGQPCWHDGTSLYVSERVIPLWRIDPTNIDRMFEFLQREYCERFEQNNHDEQEAA